MQDGRIKLGKQDRDDSIKPSSIQSSQISFFHLQWKDMWGS